MNLRHGFGVALAWLAGLAFALDAHALSITYTVDGWGPQSFPGPVPPPANAPWGPAGYPGDTVQLEGLANTVDLPVGSTILQINTLLWTIDYTYAGTATDPNEWSNLSFAFDASRSMNLNGVAGNLSQAGTLDVTWENDYLALAAGPMLSFLLNGYTVQVTPLALDRAGGSDFSGGNPWTQPSRGVMARFDVAPVPEADATAGLLVLALFGAAALRRAFAH